MSKKSFGKTPAYRAALTGVFAALCITVGLIERLVTAGLPLPPGVKPGLGNVAVMLVCFLFGGVYAFSIILIKSVFLLIVSGLSSAFISLCGGLLSVTGMVLLHRFAGKITGPVGISVAGAVLHNSGQLLASSLLVGSALYLNYAPVLLVSGVICGVITGIILHFTQPAVAAFLNGKTARDGADEYLE